MGAPHLVEVPERTAIGWNWISEVEEPANFVVCVYAVDDLHDFPAGEALEWLEMEANVRSGSQLRCVLERFDCSPNDLMDRTAGR